MRAFSLVIAGLVALAWVPTASAEEKCLDKTEEATDRTLDFSGAVGLPSRVPPCAWIPCNPATFQVRNDAQAPGQHVSGHPQGNRK